MNRDLHPGHVLHGRFVLDRPLRAGVRTHLWMARDNQLDAPFLLRIYAAPSPREQATLETIKRIARYSRRLQHPHIARVHDVHVGEEILLVSIEPHDGALLATSLQDAAPMPYQHMIDAVRPLVEALLHMHEHGGEHGQLDAEHVLIAAETRWILLPGDGMQPARSDMQQLGRLMTAALTAGTEQESELNDAAELLHEGRTIPALLNQLIVNLRMTDASLRPSSMRDVLHRLDQLEKVVAPSAEQRRVAHEGSATIADEGPPAATAGVSRDRVERSRGGRAARLAWAAAAIVLIGLAVAAFLVLPRLTSRLDSMQAKVPPPAAVAAPPAPPSAETEEAAAANAALVAAARQAADEALNEYVAVRGEADAIGAERWGLESYDTAAAVAAEADRAFLGEEYGAAAAKYRTAVEGLTLVLGAREDVLQRLLQDGRTALAAPDAAAATAAFENALLIEPGSDEARIGRQRASTLDELHGLLASGAAHENEGRLAFSYADFSEASRLDPHSEEAAHAAQRVKERIIEEEFQGAMSAGLEAYTRGDYAEARRSIVEAGRIRPESTDATKTLTMIDEARLRREVTRLQEQALVHEQAEQWQAARSTYRQVLAIDAAIQFAQEGVARSEEVLKLEQSTQHYLDHLESLTKPGSREDALRLVKQLEAFGSKGAKLEAASARLTEAVRQANTPRRVLLRSDEKTKVDVYKVGRYGAFRTMELELLPGEYTIVGHRKGYKDVRLKLHVKPADEQAAVEVVCKESV